MDIAELKAAIAGLEDGLQVVVWVDEDELQVIEGRYESHATFKRGFVLIADDPECGSLRNQISDLKSKLEDAEMEIAALLKAKEKTPA